MKKILTRDNSFTYYNEKYGESYHATSGAEEEALKKFIEPSKLVKFAENNKEIRILDVCFGLGYNTAAAIDALFYYDTNNHKKIKLSITVLENDPAVFELIASLKPNFKSYWLIKKLSATNTSISENNIEIKLLVGDARDSVKLLNKSKQKFDFCFFDPFSPKKCPELWQKEFLSDIYNLMNNNGILTTYSYARTTRENLAKAGFILKDGPVVGRRSPSLIGVKENKVLKQPPNSKASQRNNGKDEMLHFKVF